MQSEKPDLWADFRIVQYVFHNLLCLNAALITDHKGAIIHQHCQKMINTTYKCVSESRKTAWEMCHLQPNVSLFIFSGVASVQFREGFREPGGQLATPDAQMPCHNCK